MNPAQEDINTAWQTETGLVDDIDGIIVNPRFGVKEEYAQQVSLTSGGAETGLMFMVDLMDDNGEVIGNQGWSIGSGWEASEDGRYITHPKRQNVVNSSLYGQLQDKVTRGLQVPIGQYGLPTDAMAWNYLKFHWMQTAHKTVSGVEKTSLMPTEFFGKVEFEGEEEAAAAEVPAPAPAPAPITTPAPAPRPVATAPRPAAAPAQPAAASIRTRLAAKTKAAVNPNVEKAKELLSQHNDAKSFAKAAVRIPEIANDDALVAEILEEGPTGFFAKNKVA